MMLGRALLTQYNQMILGFGEWCWNQNIYDGIDHNTLCIGDNALGTTRFSLVVTGKISGTIVPFPAPRSITRTVPKKADRDSSTNMYPAPFKIKSVFAYPLMLFPGTTIIDSGLASIYFLTSR
jgi:hypothetical protein